MEGASGAYGAVACTTRIKNPIVAADSLLENGPHCILAGPAADTMAEKRGLDMVGNDYFSTALRRAHWDQHRSSGKEVSNEDENVGTVGAIVLDTHGQLSAGGSTGGLTWKSEGRIGDTAILGAGLFADARVAVVWYTLLSSFTVKYPSIQKRLTKSKANFDIVAARAIRSSSICSLVK